MSQIASTVYIVDDDEDVQHSVRYLMESVGLRTEIYSSAPAFMAAYRDEGPSCVILDLRMPGMSGLEAQQQLRERGVHIPVIVVTGHGDVPAAVRAMKLGAVEFLEKPCNDQVLIDIVNKAIEEDAENRIVRQRLKRIKRNLMSLSARETEVMRLLVEGGSNKEVARRLGLSPKTIERHRASIMRKLSVGSFAELVKEVTAVRVLSADSREEPAG